MDGAHWIFTLYGGDFELDLESSREVFDSRWGFFADHRSEEWKIRIRPYFNYDLYIVRREDEEDIRSSISRHGLDSFVIKSLGSHWSIAIFGTYVTRNDRNLRHRGTLLPGCGVQPSTVFGGHAAHHHAVLHAGSDLYGLL